MVTDELIRKQFIHQILRRDVNFIYTIQSEVLRTNLDTNKRALQMAGFLASRPFRIAGDGLKPSYYMSIFPYLRFLDITYSKRDMGLRSRLALYNRVVWGRLYHETISDLRYGLTQDMKNNIRERLEKMNPQKL